ncbi:hypothetical protein O2V63_14695 [Modestobacter sp. VKM Ac-2977]|uniref:hypothetical protein n=1 Tax=Modestobacter sp. VKM Ac-2977 TaxID=3004131 RepID=UPI0022AADEF3|nr:hypothetical protein [Modestobacter sp. VKM Ac-2977]MCZ2821591.1 hypothetical protein [Modestobacter sp. VKM Ac-2977]
MRDARDVISSDEEMDARLQGVQRRRAMAATEEAELILALAGRRPAALDPEGPGARRPDWASEAGGAEISEFFFAELSALLPWASGLSVARLEKRATEELLRLDAQPPTIAGPKRRGPSTCGCAPPLPTGGRRCTLPCAWRGHRLR